MSLTGFDTLLAQHPDRRQAISQLAEQIVRTLRVDPSAVIDEAILSQQIHAQLDIVRELLVELVALYALDTRLFWQCPNGRGTVLEETALDRFPLSVECDRCGELHTFKSKDVQVKFVPSGNLLQSIRSERS
jgi:hypothetical protein